MNPTFLKQNYIIWSVRILLALLFLLSGIAKLFPIWLFEKQLVDLDFASWCSAHYLSRGIIALELAIGIATLQKHYLRQLILPITIALLFIFSVHLLIEILAKGATAENCGCFGTLIPMSPLQALVKNLIAIVLAIYLHRLDEYKRPSGQRVIYPFTIFITAMLVVFALFPFCPCADKAKNDNRAEYYRPKPFDKNQPTDSLSKETPKYTSASENSIPRISRNKEIAEQEIKSRFHDYTTFGSQYVNLDEGKKIICMFAPGCDHCLEAAKKITALKKDYELPDIYIFFMDEETERIPDFFVKTGYTYPYNIIGISTFWTLIGNRANTPGVFFMQNGKIIRSWEGKGVNTFNEESFVNLFKKRS
jgi:thiol-disulfide isomerase/thioredoxin